MQIGSVRVFLEYEWAWVCNIREVKIGHLMYYCIFARTKNLANLIAVRRWAFAIPLISWESNWIAKQWTLNIAYYFSIPNKRSTIKVHIFWEGREILRNLHLTFDCKYCSQKLGEEFAKFCGLLRIYEL